MNRNSFPLLSPLHPAKRERKKKPGERLTDQKDHKTGTSIQPSSNIHTNSPDYRSSFLALHSSVRA